MAAQRSHQWMPAAANSWSGPKRAWACTCFAFLTTDVVGSSTFKLGGVMISETDGDGRTTATGETTAGETSAAGETARAGETTAGDTALGDTAAWDTAGEAHRRRRRHRGGRDRGRGGPAATAGPTVSAACAARAAADAVGAVIDVSESFQAGQQRTTCQHRGSQT